MTISSMLSLQHSGAIQITSNTTDTSQLTELAGYFQAALEQQISAAETESNISDNWAGSQLAVGMDSQTLASGKQLPLTGTALPIEQVLARIAEAIEAHTSAAASTEQATDESGITPSFSLNDIEQTLQSLRQYFVGQQSVAGQQSTAEHRSFNGVNAEVSTTQAQGLAPDRSTPVQFSELASIIADSPALQSALKMAERNGRLFESSLPGRETTAAQHNGATAKAAVPLTDNTVTHSLSSVISSARAMAMALNIPDTAQTGEGQRTPAIQSSDSPQTLADLSRRYDLKSLDVSRFLSQNSGPIDQALQQGVASRSIDLSPQGIRLSTGVFAPLDEVTDAVTLRTRVDNTAAIPPLVSNDQRGLSSTEAGRSVTGGVETSAANTGLHNQAIMDELVQSRLGNTAVSALGELRNTTSEARSQLMSPVEYSAINGKPVSISVSTPELPLPDPAAVLNRQALNAEAFRSTVRAAFDRGLGRQQDNTMRTDHNPMTDTRPVDGDVGRTIALPSVTAAQSFIAAAGGTASLSSGLIPGMAGAQADAAAALGDRIQWMINSSAQRANIQIDPPELGSVSIQIAQDDRQTTVSFVTQTANARELIEQSLPRLREHLESLGIELADANVEQQSADSANQKDGEAGALANAGDDTLVTDETNAADAGVGAESQRDGGIDAYA